MLGRSSRSKGFRDPKRDARSDLLRAETVLKAVADALLSLDAELAGLGRRVDELRVWVGGLIGPEDSSEGARDSQIEAELVDAERQLMQGLERMSSIAVIRGIYCDLQAAITFERDRAFQAARADV